MTVAQQRQYIINLMDELHEIVNTIDDNVSDNPVKDFKVGDILETVRGCSASYNTQGMAAVEQYKVLYVENSAKLFMRLKIISSPNPKRVGRFITVTSGSYGIDYLMRVSNDRTYIDTAIKMCQEFIDTHTTDVVTDA